MMGNENSATETLRKASPTLQSGKMLSSPVDGAPAWFAVGTRGHMEKSTQERLDGQGIKTLLPIVVRRQYARKRKTVTIKELLIPSYVFVHVTLTAECRHLIQETKGVLGLVGRYVTRRLGGQREKFVVPLPMPAGEIGRLLAVVNADGLIEQPAETAVDLTGRLLRVLAGPFTSFPGVCEECDLEKQRVVVGVEIFGRSTPVELDYDDVEPIRSR